MSVASLTDATPALNSKTDAIVLHLAPHSEKASLLHLYTRQHGRTLLLVYGRHSRKNKGVQALLEPLSILHVEAVMHDNGTIGQLRECSLAYVPTRLLFDNNRRCVALFIAEMLSRTLSHPQQDEMLYDFLVETIRELDTCDDPQNAHIRFLIHYAAILGFAIDFTDPENQALAVLQPLLSQPLSRFPRKAALHALLDYYSRHVPDFTMPNSLPVLEAVFND